MKLFRRFLWSTLPVLACTISSSACSQNVSDIFPDEEVSKFVSCAAKQALENCRLSPAKMNYRGKDNWDPLLWLLAKERISPEKMVALIKAGADPHQPGTPTAAGYAIRYLPIEYLKALVGMGLDVNSLPRKDEDRGWDDAFIFSAIGSRDIEKVKYLIDHGANIELRDSLGRTPILAADLNQFDVQILLLDHGADPTVVDSRGLGICNAVETLPFKPSENMNRFLEMLKRRGVECKVLQKES